LKRLQFIITVVAASLGASALPKRFAPAKPAIAPRRVAGRGPTDYRQTLRGRSRRLEHWIQGKYCNGELDHLYTPAQVADRKARCAKICGLCRYIYSLEQWPPRPYRRPPRAILDALEREPVLAVKLASE